MAQPITTTHFYWSGTSPHSRIDTSINASSSTVIKGGLTLLGVGGISSSSSGGDTYNQQDTASSEPVTAYKLSTATPSSTELTASKSYLTTDSGAKEKLLKAFVTDTGDPNVSQNLTGDTWTFYFECYYNDVSRNLLGKQIFAKVYKRDNSDTNTFLFQTGSTGITTTKSIRTKSVTASGSLAVTDRLYIEIWAKWTTTPF